jgi:MFS family permease
MVFGAFTGYIVYAAQFQTTYGVFIYHLSAEMGWSRSGLSGVVSLGRLFESALAPFVGAFVDRHGSRNVLLIGAGVVGLGFVLLSTVNEIWQLYLYKGVILALGAMLTGPLVMGVAVNNWFVEKRGRALALVRLGDTVGTALLPIATAMVIAAGGWRWGWLVTGIVAIIVLVPMSRLFLRRPEDYGLLPDGVDPREADKPRDAARERRRAALLAVDVVWTRRAVVRTTAFWSLIVVQGITFGSVVAANLHLVPYVQELGYSIEVAALVVGARAWIGLITYPAWGLLIERIPIRPAAASQYLIVALGMAMLALVEPGSSLGLGVALAVLGLGTTGFYVVTEVIWANYFGRISLGTVRGIAQPITAIFIAAAPLAMGLVYDTTGGYQRAWLGVVAGFVLAAGLILITRPPATREA